MNRKQSVDADLLAAVPDADAVRALYERHVFLELFSAAASYDRRRSEVRVWLLGVASRCLADQRRSDYRRAEVAARRAVAPELRGDEHERVEAMIDAARLAPTAERALAVANGIVASTRAPVR